MPLQGYTLNSDFSAIRGDTWDVGKLLSNNETSNLTAMRGGSAINLTGALGIRMTACTDPYNPAGTNVFTKTVGSGITVVTPASGTFTVTVLPADTSAQPPAILPLYYDIQVTDSAGVITTVYRGIITLIPDQSITSP